MFLTVVSRVLKKLICIQRHEIPVLSSRRNQFMRKFLHVRYVVLLVSIFVVAYGCDSSGNVGADLTNQNVDLLATDTLTINSATVLMDSVVTQGTGSILAGSYDDNYLGRVTADGYIRPSLGNILFVTKNPKAHYDSLRLHLSVNYYYGKTDESQSLKIYRVTQYIQPTGNNTVLYNFDSLDHGLAVVGKATFVPDKTDTLSVPISDEIGQELFTAGQEGKDIATIDQDFQKYLKGFVIVGDKATNTAITGFKSDSVSSIYLRIYYTDVVNGIVREQFHDFPLIPSLTFSHIESEKPASLGPLKQPKDAVPSTQTGDMAFMQSGTGIMTSLQFPTVKNLFNLSSKITLASAGLYIYPVAFTYGSSTTPLPDSLMLYIGDQQNRIIGRYTDSYGNVVTSAPKIDEEYNKNTYYYFNITSYIQSELETERNTNRELLISPSYTRYNGSVDRVVFGDALNKKFKMRLQVTLTKLKN